MIWGKANECISTEIVKKTITNVLVNFSSVKIKIFFFFYSEKYDDFMMADEQRLNYKFVRFSFEDITNLSWKKIFYSKLL